MLPLFGLQISVSYTTVNVVLSLASYTVLNICLDSGVGKVWFCGGIRSVRIPIRVVFLVDHFCALFL